jgi:hypothetical protein
VTDDNLNWRDQRAVEASAGVAKERWVAIFDTILHVMLDYEMRPEAARKQVSLCAELADVALDEIERRWTA